MSLTPKEPDTFRSFDIKLSNGSIKKIFLVRIDLKVKGLSGKRRVIIETDRIGDWTNVEVSYFISNATKLRDDTVIRYYHRRN